VPLAPFAAPLRLTVDFDSGPLAGRLHAEAAVDVDVPVVERR
jgi:hypothetical protein